MRWFIPVLLLCLSAPAAARELVADLSNHLISIRTDFDGEELVLFGMVDPPLAAADNIVILVRGTPESVKVRRKHPQFGIWMNTEYALFEPVPSFYRMLSVRPVTQTVDDGVRSRHEIGVANIRKPISMADLDGEDIPAFREALSELRRANGLYADAEQTVAFLPGNRLFRARILFPRNVPPGNYQIDIFQIQDGQIIDAQTTPLHVSRDGIGADMHFFAMTQPFWYAVAGIALALLSGWAGALAFRRL